MLSKAICKKLNLHDGRIRSNSIVHNGGWYNSIGDKIGWGDLAASDMPEIQSKLEPGEMFVVLGEQDSFWNFVTHIGIIGSMSKVSPDEQHPGVNYLSEKVRWIVTSDVIYNVIDGSYMVDWGFPCQTIVREKVASLLIQGK